MFPPAQRQIIPASVPIVLGVTTRLLLDKDRDSYLAPDHNTAHMQLTAAQKVCSSLTPQLATKPPVLSFLATHVHQISHNHV
jgi:hypothetical protein